MHSESSIHTRATNVADSGAVGSGRPLGERLAGLAQYRTIIYLATFLSGGVSLTFQVVWQRYLSFMVGSEARSISLVVAVFLLGLAAGYRFWGNFTARGWTRKTMLKAVGYIELGIAAYGILFPSLFPLVRDVAYAAPDLLLVDFAATLGLLFIPTFLMGASIPLLTAAVPATMKEVNYCHTRIYGINTLGAFLGAFVAGFYLVPNSGLPMSLYIGAILNMGVAIAFLANNLEGQVQEGEQTPSIPNRFGSSGIYLFVFVTGAVTIAFEVLFMRILALSIGSGHYVFPIVVGIVILGLAIGSLSIRRGSVTANRVVRDLMQLSVLLVLVYFTVPYWGYWMSNVRVSLVTIPSNYPVFLAIVVLFTAVMLLPIVIPMGRLLPMGYSLIDKKSSDYGKLCGRVYFSNTIGTVVGAVGLGYLLLIFLNIDTIFVVNIAMLLALAAYLGFRQRMDVVPVACMGLAAIVLALPWLPYGQWNRLLHVQGMFRESFAQPHHHFRGVFAIPSMIDEENVLYLRDDPSVTVAAISIDRFRERPSSRTIYVNGKSDGNTVADYSNMALTGLLPYLYSPKDRDIDAAVIGLGMGITSGSLATLEDTRSVTTLEISSGVMEAIVYFDDFNFQLSTNPKSTIVKTDAFRYFTRGDRTFDIIISEPSNPWVVGVENLFTPEFYTLATDRLAPDGIFFQWLQIYEMDSSILAAIVRNVADHFEHVSLFVLGPVDVGILASNAPLEHPHLSRRMNDDAVLRVLSPMAIDDEDLFVALELMSTEQVRSFGLTSDRPVHRMERPWLGLAAGRARFLQRSVRFDTTVLEGTGRHLVNDPKRRERFEQLADEYGGRMAQFCRPSDPKQHSTQFICELLEVHFQNRRQMRRPLTLSDLSRTRLAYHQLRERGFIDADVTLLDRMRAMLLESHSDMPREEMESLLSQLITEYVLELQWDAARELAHAAHELGMANEDELDFYEDAIRNQRRQFMERMEALATFGSAGIEP